MRFVLDASAALSLLLEEDAEGTGHEVGGLFSRGDSAVVPTLFIHEITNVLVTAVRRKRIESADAIELLGGLASLPITVDGRTVSAPRVLELAVLHGLSAYDASYLELAMSMGTSLASNDHSLLRAAAKESVPRA
jgi:predicted nucleic acid-binding protein